MSAREMAIAVRVGQVWEWRGQMASRDRYRVEFVGPETVALMLLRPPTDRRPREVTRVSRVRLAAEYDMTHDAPPAPRRGRPPRADRDHPKEATDAER